MKITIIGGGNMGGAIALGLAKGGVVAPQDITVTARTESTLSKIKSISPQINVSTDNCAAVDGADMVIMAVKPWLLEEVLTQLRGRLDYSRQSVASVVAGVSFDDLARMLDNGSSLEPVMYRIIPNTAISIGRSVTFIASHGADTEALSFVKRMFEQLGEVFIVDENMMVAGTSLASCGIAFALRYIDASISAGVEAGFGENEARDIVIQTVQGAIDLLYTNGTMPQTEIDRVTTKGGITLKGLAAMEENGFSGAVAEGIRKSR